MRPDFSLIWGADNAPFTAIEASDYTAGWVFRTGAPPRRVNFDYFQNLSDQRSAWLGEQMLLAVGHEWQDDVTYNLEAYTRSPVNDKLYKSLDAANLANEPSATPLKWKEVPDLSAGGSLPFGYFAGFTLSNNGGAPNTTVDTAQGTARSSDNTVDITLTSTISGILQSSGAWAAGTGQNKLDTGAKANSSTYHVFAIRKTSDGTGDILFSLSATAPTMPVGYAGFRRVGRIATDGSGNIRAFKDRGNGCFDWATPLIEVTAGPVTGATSLLTLTGLGGVGVIAKTQIMAYGDAALIRLTPSDVSDAALGFAETTFTGGVIAQAGGGSGDESASGEFEVATDTSSQVRLRTAAAGNLRYRVITFGWKENR